MTLLQLQCLIEVVVTGNYSEAAERLYTTQSTVSKQIMALEKEIGEYLIDRTTRPCRLTPAGQTMIGHYREIILAYNRAELALEEFKRQNKMIGDNSFRLYGIPAMTALGVTASIFEFERRHPEFHVYQQELDEDRIILGLKSGECDIAFGMGTNLNLNEFSTHLVCRENLCVVIAKNERLEIIPQKITLDMLKDYYWIFPPFQAGHYRLCVEACVKAGFNPNVILETSRPRTGIEYLLNHNENVAYMEIEGIIKHYLNERVRKINLDTESQIEMYYAYHKERKLPKAAYIYLNETIKQLNNH